MGAHSHHQHQSDHDVDQWAGNGDQELLARLFRNALEPRHAADRKQNHVRRRHAERARGEDVAEFVGEHAGKQQHHEDQAGHRRFGPAGGPARRENPDQEHEKSNVDFDRRAGDRADVHRPQHGGSPATECVLRTPEMRWPGFIGQGRRRLRAAIERPGVAGAASALRRFRARDLYLRLIYPRLNARVAHGFEAQS